MKKDMNPITNLVIIARKSIKYRCCSRNNRKRRFIQYLFSLFSILIFLLCLITIKIRAEEGEDSIFGVGYAVKGYAKLVAQMGAKWVKIPSVAWGIVEPKPPKKGKHTYQWEHLDRLVKEYEDARLHIQIVIKASCPWGAKDFAPPPEPWRKSYPPKKEHWDDYYQFVYNLVERYDGDGYKDMPGLRYPIRYYEIESEAEHSIFWAGSVEEYNRLLKIAYKAAKHAHSETKIILSGINFGKLFDEFPSPQELKQKIKHLSKRHKNALSFIRQSLSMGDYYDVIDYHYNRDYTGAYGAINWIRQELAKYGYQKEIWAGDTASVPWITDKDNRDILLILLNPRHPRHQETVNWFRAEQAKLSVKKFIVAAELGIKKVILEPIRDFPKNAYKGWAKESWFLAGIFDKDKTPRPVFYAYAQLTKKLKFFEKVERIPKKGMYFYKISFSNKEPIYIAWCDEGPQRIKLKTTEKSPYIRVEKVITTSTQHPEVKIIKAKNTKFTLTLDDTPVFIEFIPERKKIKSKLRISSCSVNELSTT